MSKDVLLISMMDGAENCARMMGEQMSARVDVASSRKSGLIALRHGDYGVVVVDASLVDTDPDWADQVWAHAGLALPVQINFAISGTARLLREVKAAVVRREGEHTLARRAAAAQIENELKTSVTGLMLESELALREPSIPPALEPKLRRLVELAAALRERLRREARGTDVAA
jgi:hypothetical protein